MSNTARIAIVEDNDDLREELIFFLHAHGYPVWGQNSAESFWKHLHGHPADIVLVDIGLPGEDGFSVVNYLNTLGGYGIIVMTARGGREDRLRGLNLGADQYMTKPVNFAELLSAIAALWSRIQQNGAPTGLPAPATEPAWGLDDEQRMLHSPEGTALTLTSQEYKLVEVLYRNRNEVCNKEMLHDLLFGYAEQPDTHRIDVVLNRIRSKARAHNMQLPVRAIFGKGLVFLTQPA